MAAYLAAAMAGCKDSSTVERCLASASEEKLLCGSRRHGRRRNSPVESVSFHAGPKAERERLFFATAADANITSADLLGREPAVDGRPRTDPTAGSERDVPARPPAPAVPPATCRVQKQKGVVSTTRLSRWLPRTSERPTPVKSNVRAAPAGALLGTQSRTGHMSSLT